MRKIKVKRLVYFQVGTGKVFPGAESYDGNLYSHAILCSVYTKGKHEWSVNQYDYPALYQMDEHGKLKYIIHVQNFYQYQKTWIDMLCDEIKRALQK